MYYVNARQTKLERRLKYKALREANVPVCHAHRKRDWTVNHIEQNIDWNNLKARVRKQVEKLLALARAEIKNRGSV